MKAIPHCEKAEDYEALLPWNIGNRHSNYKSD